MPNTTSNLLNANEKLDIYGQPILTADEITEFFSFNASELKALRSFRDTSHALYFAISLAFFKLKGTLIQFGYQSTTKERQHVMERYFPSKSTPKSLPKNSNTLVRIENKVLQVCGYCRFSSKTKEAILAELHRQAPRFPRQRQLCQKALELFNKYYCEIPGFTSLQTIITQVWNAEHNRIGKACHRHTTPAQKQAVLSLLQQTDKLHRIVSIKSDMKNFTNTELDKELSKHQQLKQIFEIAHSVLPKLRLPMTSINYYGNMINFYNGSRLKTIKKNDILLYLLCYSFTRYQTINDNLLEALKKRINDYIAKAVNYATIQAAKRLEETKDYRKKASDLLITLHDHKGESVPKSDIHKHISESELLTIAMLLVDDELDKDFLFWQYIDTLEHAIELSLQRIFLALDFIIVQDEELRRIVEFMKKALKNKNEVSSKPLPSFVEIWIGKKDGAYLLSNETFRFNRVVFLFYKKLVQNISTNKITLKHTIVNKDLEDDVYSKKKWKREKTKILNDLNYPLLKQPINSQLKKLKEGINIGFKAINHDVRHENKADLIIKTDKSGHKTWRLRPLEKAVDPNDSLFSSFKRLSVVDAIKFVDEKTNFTKAFYSILARSKKGKMDKALIMAIVLANAIRIGARKISDISDLNESSLVTAEAAYIRTETLNAAVDVINNATAKLAIFDKWYINTVYHGSLDGQKLPVRRNHVMARNSPKYFGLGIGVSNYNAILNHLPISGKLIGTNQYEGNYTFEMIEHQNTSELQFDWLSTDKHGTNSLNFLLFYVTGRYFAPRIPKPHREILWGFDSLDNYKNHLIKPKKIADEELIAEEWDNIQRFIASMIMGKTPPHIIIVL